MSIWYVDPELGSNLNGGSSWSVLISSSDGVANGTTTFTSATGGFTGKENHWMYIQSGKNVRRQIVTVNSDTSVVLSGSVSSGSSLVFIVGGAVLSTSASQLTVSAGDTVRLPADSGQYSIGNATWTNQSETVTLASSKNLRIDEGIFQYVASANITTAITTTRKAHDAAVSITPASAFLTGLVAYQKLYTQCTGGSSSASSTLAGTNASYAFDNTQTYYWTCNNALPAWVKYDFGSGVQKTWTQYGIVGGSQQNFDPKDFKLQGSNNDTDWTDLDTRSTITLSPRLGITWFTIASPAAYRYYRLYVTATYAAGNYVSIRQLVYTEGVYDFSSYQQITFWMYTSTTVTSGTYQIKLCSDDAGATAVNTFTVTGLYGGYQPFTLDNGSALGSNIKSIAIYAVTDPGTTGVYFNSFNACKAPSSSDCLSYSCTIATGQGNMEYGIDSIEGATLKIADRITLYSNAYNIKYYGTTSTYTTYVRQCVQCHLTDSTLVTYSANCSAVSRGLITGGWRRSDDTQTGVTWLSGTNISIITMSGDYVDIEKIGFLRASYAVTNSGDMGCTMQIEGMAAVDEGLYITGVAYDITVTLGHMNGQELIYTYNGVHDVSITVQDMVSYNLAGSYAIRLYSACYNITLTANDIYNGSYSIYLVSPGNTVTFHDIRYSGTYAIQLSGADNNTINCTGQIIYHQGNYEIGMTGGACNNTFNNLYITGTPAIGAYPIWATGSCFNNRFNNFYSTGHTASWVGFAGALYGSFYFNGGTGTELPITAAQNAYSQIDTGVTYIMVDRYGGDATDNRRYQYGGYAKSQTTTRHTDSGLAWQLCPITELKSTKPIRLPIFTGWLSANTTYTISAYFYRDNSGISGGLFCKAYQLPGITTDKTAAISLTSQWQQLSIQVTPTVSGVVTVEATAYGGTSYSVYVDDVTIS